MLEAILAACVHLLYLVLTSRFCMFLARHFLIPWTGGAFAPLGPFLCPTTGEKNDLLPQSQGPMTCIESKLTLKRSLKTKFVGEHT
jgi:hypothetical protein